MSEESLKDRSKPDQANVEPPADSAPDDRKPGENLDKRQDQLLDEAIEESFPASDPVTPKRIT